MTHADFDFIRGDLRACDRAIYKAYRSERNDLLICIEHAIYLLGRIKEEMASCRMCAVCTAECPDGLCNLCRERKSRDHARREHGVADGNRCQTCNREYHQARLENAETPQ